MMIDAMWQRSSPRESDLESDSTFSTPLPLSVTPSRNPIVGERVLKKCDLRHAWYSEWNTFPGKQKVIHIGAMLTFVDYANLNKLEVVVWQGVTERFRLWNNKNWGSIAVAHSFVSEARSVCPRAVTLVERKVRPLCITPFRWLGCMYLGSKFHWRRDRLSRRDVHLCNTVFRRPGWFE